MIQKKLVLLATVMSVAFLAAAVGCVASLTSADSVESTEETMQKEQPGQTGKRVPVLVELFTSEGCSSCPPADRFLQTLQNEQPIENVEVVALSEHVDYWNYIGWTDPFSSSQFSVRQGEYSRAFGKKGNVYTPQAVVDGTREFVGGNQEEGLKRISEAAKATKGDVGIETGNISGNAAAVKVTFANLPQIASGDRAIALLAVAEDNIALSVARGENAGRRLTHTAVVRYLQNVGDVTGDTKLLTHNLKLQRGWEKKNLSLVAFVQETGSRRVLGIAKVKLDKRS